MTDIHKYDAIINLPHRQSPTRPHMSMDDRAAQFAPFATLHGYDAAVREAEENETEIINEIPVDYFIE